MPRLNPLYKRLMLLALVLGPFVWLVVTEDGRRRSDLVVLFVLGEPEVSLAIERLDGRLTEGDMRRLYPELELVCRGVTDRLGDRVCAADIGVFNQIPARGIAIYLQDDGLTAVRVDYRRAYHASLGAQITRRLGRPPRDPSADPAVWPVAGGLLLMSRDRPKSEDDAALFWIADAVVRHDPGADERRAGV